jgi:hypothetical protein
MHRADQSRAVQLREVRYKCVATHSNFGDDDRAFCAADDTEKRAERAG